MSLASKGDDVTEVRDSRPSLGEDGAGVGIDLREADGSPAGTLKPKVKPSDAREEAGVRRIDHRRELKSLSTARMKSIVAIATAQIATTTQPSMVMAAYPSAAASAAGSAGQ